MMMTCMWAVRQGMVHACDSGQMAWGRQGRDGSLGPTYMLLLKDVQLLLRARNSQPSRYIKGGHFLPSRTTVSAHERDTEV